MKPFEINIVLKEDNIKNVLGYNLIQLPFLNSLQVE